MPIVDLRLALACHPSSACGELEEQYGPALKQGGYDRVAASLNGARYRRSWYPGWLVALMVLTFPLGLVLLVAKQTSEVVMQVIPSEFGCEVRVTTDGARLSRRVAAELSAAPSRGIASSVPV